MLIVLMGVSGSGKSTVGQLLASRLGCPFLEADEFHPQANRKKLEAGIPLTDEDRWPWLEALNRGLIEAARDGGSLVLACSALKDSYRDRLDDGLPSIHWVHLVGNQQLLEDRLQHRVGHFSSAKILPSQFADLEPPPDAIQIRVDRTPAHVVEHVAHALDVADVDPHVSNRLIARHLMCDEQRAADGSESVQQLQLGNSFQLERRVSWGSSGAAEPENWRRHDEPEWRILMSGNSQLWLRGNANPYDVGPGDAWLVPAGQEHRFQAVDADEAAVWMMLRFRP